MQAQLREILMDKILLNPGPTNTSEEVKDSQHRWSDVCHRTDEFVELLIDTKEKILKRFILLPAMINLKTLFLH